MQPLTEIRAVQASGLTANQKWLLVTLITRVDNDTKCTRVGIPLFSELTGMSQSRIKRTLKQLEELGLIKREQRKGTSTLTWYRPAVVRGEEHDPRHIEMPF